MVFPRFFADVQSYSAFNRLPQLQQKIAPFGFFSPQLEQTTWSFMK
jgi:hypothetical protein